MTDHEQIPDLAADPCAIVEAFADGEPVARAALSAALSDPAAREHLLDVLILRDAIGTMTPPRWQHVRRSRAPWLAAAAAVLLSVVGGYYAGQRAISADPAHTTIETSIDLSLSPAAPSPTRVVTLQPGVNWVEGQGGR
jgi:hypothetical protein